MNIHSANILRLFQQYVVSQDAQLSHKYVDQVWSPSCSYRGNKCDYGEVGAQYAFQCKLVGTALMRQKTHFPSVIYTKTHTTLANLTLNNVQKKIRPKPIHVEMRMN